MEKISISSQNHEALLFVFCTMSYNYIGDSQGRKKKKIALHIIFLSIVN